MGLDLLSKPATIFQKNSGESIDLEKVTTLILSGGEGNRLFPFTKHRCKPAICYGGRHRLIDIAVSNALNSGLKKIFILSQYLSYSLHKHLFKTYRSGGCSSHCVEALTPEAKPNGKFWFEGTADAVRQNLHYLSDLDADYFLILSGDHLYRMDMRAMIKFAQETEADAIVATIPITEADAKRMGILQIDDRSFIHHFHEKPQTKEELLKLRLPSEQQARLKQFGQHQATCKEEYLGSMGIYLFKRKALFNLLKDDPREDFGKHLIPTMVSSGNIAAYIHQSYWKDIGTIESFYHANMELTLSSPPFDLYDEKWPFYSSNHNPPGARISHTNIQNSILCEGSAIEATEITSSIIGPRTTIHEGTIIRDSYVMGNDYFSAPLEHSRYANKFQIGAHCLIQKAIIDKHANIGSHVQLVNKNQLLHYDGHGVYIRDGIILVPQGATLPDGFIL